MARNNPRRDAHRDMGSPSTKCPHPAPWGSAGPCNDGDGKGGYTRFWCQECGTEMRRHYYSA